jgi:predicted regulator of Ras-like GTPase activity (Roadblock/LC7/MglB family)
MTLLPAASSRPAFSAPALPTAACQQLLQEFLDGPCDVRAALVATADGRLIAVASRIEFEPSRIAAIGGSMLALSEACARELGHGTCRNSLIDCELGMTVILRVGAPQGGWALTTIGTRGSSLGLLFNHSKQLAEQLAVVAAQSHSPTPRVSLPLA